VEAVVDLLKRPAARSTHSLTIAMVPHKQLAVVVVMTWFIMSPYLSEPPTTFAAIRTVTTFLFF
jgi:hypothetical protein